MEEPVEKRQNPGSVSSKFHLAVTAAPISGNRMRWILLCSIESSGAGLWGTNPTAPAADRRTTLMMRGNARIAPLRRLRLS
jgi:hypothetical protein